ncbi:MAG: Cell division protein FtsX [Patescibacteria group bacterium]|nr:ABC transporter permease [Candidatus Saccharibacteria bacterium]MDQ5963603.1 Cell division protein FtsX [Patescibacteria group bacterium]
MSRRSTTFARIIRAGMLNFVRNAWLAIAAMAIMSVTLTIILFSIIANATFHNTIEDITSKINISIYLKDSATPAQTKEFIAGLKSLENVEEVKYLDKAAALKAYMRQNQGNTQLLSAINETDNPLPATIQVKPKELSQLKEIRTYVEQPKYAKLQSDPASDNGDRREAIDNITHATNIMRKAGFAAVAVFAVISIMIIFNTIQMAIFNRREEIQIMRLLGAGTAYIRGPFVVEAIIYGILSAIISLLVINGIFITASSSLQASSFGLLDISYSQQFFQQYYWHLLALQLTLGILIGAVSSTFATRRYLKFKAPK